MLLTSGGITNQTIADALDRLIGKAPAETKIGFIPTAAHAEPGNKDWFLGQLDALRQYGWKWIDVVDIANSVINWQSRLMQVDVLFVSGGNTFYLLNAVRKSGFDKWLQKNLQDKVYVGASAGSIIMTPSIEVATIPPADDNFLKLKNLSGLDIVDVEIEPHCDQNRSSVIKKWAEKYSRHIFAIDDQSALLWTQRGELVGCGDGIIQEYDYK